MKTTLSQLKIGQSGIISDVNIEEIPLKLIEMGYVELIQIAPFGDPLYFNINDSHVAIRLETAKEIEITFEKN